jgi:hypothetical protein
MAEQKDRIRVQIEGRAYAVVGGNFQDMLAVVKQINGRRFVSEQKVWQLPGSAENIQNQLEISGFWLEEGGTPMAQEAKPAQVAPPKSSGGDRIRVLIQGHELAVVGGSFQDMLAEVKNLPGRRYNGERKIWEIPGDGGVILGLVQAAGYQLEGVEKLQLGPAPSFEPPKLASKKEPPPYRAPAFQDNDDIPPYEPPDWWDDDNLPPPMETPDWFDDETASLPPNEPGFPGQRRTDNSPPAATRGNDQIRIRVGGIPMVVSGGEFKAMLDVIKKIPGRRFDSQDKVWDIPAEMGLEGVQQMVKAAGFMMERG